MAVVSVVIFAGLATTMVAATGIRPSATIQSEVAVDVDGARNFILEYLKLLEDGEIEKVRKQYVNDDRFAWFTDGQKRYSTPDEVIKGLNEVRATGVRLRTSTHDLEILPLGSSHVSARTSFETRAFGPEGERFSFSGIMTIVLEFQVGGSWKIIYGHTSTPGGPPSD
tara:strand:- start:16241 stop:16744 length:504 start_codon:yes stop_codon:yes gene_type:complete